MGSFKGLKVLETSQQLEFRCNGKTVGVVNKKFLRELLTPTEQKPRKKKRRKKASNTEDKALLVKAQQLSKAYTKMKSGFFRKSKNVADIMPTEANFKHLKLAVQIMQRHGVTNYRTFLKAQLAGLSYLNGGKGVFPKPSQLSTTMAEHRLLEYLDAEVDEKGDVIDVDISEEDKRTPLSNNIRYQTRRERIKLGTATKIDVVYVKELQMIRRGKVESYVTDYLEELD